MFNIQKFESGRLLLINNQNSVYLTQDLSKYVKKIQDFEKYLKTMKVYI